MNYKITGNIGDFGVNLFAEAVIEEPEPPPIEPPPIVDPPSIPDPPPPTDTVTLFNEQNWHTAAIGNPVRDSSVPIPAGRYKSLNISFDVFHAGWSAVGDTYNLFWAVLERNRDMFGYGNILRNPMRLMVRHGFGQRNGEKPRRTSRLSGLTAHTWYHVIFSHVFGGPIVLSIMPLDTSSGIEGSAASTSVVMNSDIPAPYVADGSRDFRLTTGFRGTEVPEGTEVNLNEPAPYGWEWKNLNAYLLKE